MKHTSLLLVTALTIGLAGCNTVDRLQNIGKAPAQSPVTNPTLREGYQPVSMPMPAPQPDVRAVNSLWSSNRQTFFKDQRAKQVGDILTVLIDIQDEANMKNNTSRGRSASEDLKAPAFGGFEKIMQKNLPDAANPSQLADVSSTSNTTGKGEIKREEDIKLKVAAVVSQVLPNGNMVIQGRQEVRVNYENRVLEIAGVIRPEDITIENQVSYDKIAEARIAYGGKGQVTDMQQARTGQQILDVLMPF